MELFWLQLGPGDDLLDAIQGFVASENLDGATIVAAVGSLSKALIRPAVPNDTEPQVLEIERELEIVSLGGVVRRDKRLVSHLHIAVADATGSMTGGHLKSGSIVRLAATVAMLPRGTPRTS